MALLSLEFVLLASLTILWMRSFKGELRAIGLGAASLWFASSYLGTKGLLSTLLFALGGYVTARLFRRSVKWGAAAIACLTVAFVYLQGYAFLQFLLPTSLLTRAFATAGLSFLFFKMIHVAVDYGSAAIPRLPLHRYLLYCFNFTAFLIGPIQRYQDFEDQWEGKKEPLPATFEAHVNAVNRVLRGFLKKYVVGALVASYALLPNATVGHMTLPEILLGTYVFYIYLYLDFSGYCDIVIGIGALMGVTPPENFDLPFLSTNIADYWLRVHRSLTQWLTDYVFNPILMPLIRSARFERHPLVATSLALIATMTISGLWHGTTLNFLLFGLFHGVYLVLFRAYDALMQKIHGRAGAKAIRQRFGFKVGGTVLTFAVTGFAYLFFVLDTSQLLVVASKLRAR